VRLSATARPTNSEPKSEQRDLKEQDDLERSESKRDLAKILDDLMNLRPTDPQRIVIKHKAYKRDNRTIAQLKLLCGHKCELCGSAIRKKDGSFYVEAAHITPKRHKGPELANNIVVLCPNHHKEFDLGDKLIIKRSDATLRIKLNEREYSIDLGLTARAEAAKQTRA
jgi:predicted restriction endonuclease